MAKCSHLVVISHQLHPLALAEQEQLLPLVLGAQVKAMGIVLLYVFILRAEDSGSLSGPLVDCVCWRVCPEEKWEPTANAPLACCSGSAMGQ